MSDREAGREREPLCEECLPPRPPSNRATRRKARSPVPTRAEAWPPNGDPLDVAQLQPSHRSLASGAGRSSGLAAESTEGGRSRSAGPRLGVRPASGREDDEQVTWKFSMLKPQDARAGRALADRREDSKRRTTLTSEIGDESDDDFGQARLRQRAAARAAQRRRGSTGTAADIGRVSSVELAQMDAYTRRACVAFVDALQQLFLTPSTAFGFFCAHRTDIPPSDPFTSKRGPRLSSLPSSTVTRSDFVDTLPLLGVFAASILTRVLPEACDLAPSLLHLNATCVL
jgi:hypothetical protein